MKVIKPVSIGRDRLISSSVAEDDYPAYVPTENYAVGARVVYQAQVFECVQSPNVGNTPGEAPLHWALAGPTNRWAMFDSEVSTQTVGESPLRVVVRPGLINSLALLELVGTRVKVIGRDGLDGPILYEADRALEGSIVTNWYEYFFEPFSRLSELILTDLPAYGSLHLEVSIFAPSSEAACGAMICGTAYFIGDAEYGGSVGIVDYSRKDTSEAGVTTFRRRRFSRRMSTRLWLETARFAAVYRRLSELRATPCVWIGTDAEGYGPMTIYGFYKDFSIDVAYEMVNFCNLEIEGLT